MNSDVFPWEIEELGGKKRMYNGSASDHYTITIDWANDKVLQRLNIQKNNCKHAIPGSSTEFSKSKIIVTGDKITCLRNPDNIVWKFIMDPHEIEGVRLKNENTHGYKVFLSFDKKGKLELGVLTRIPPQARVTEQLESAPTFVSTDVTADQVQYFFTSTSGCLKYISVKVGKSYGRFGPPVAPPDVIARREKNGRYKRLRKFFETMNKGHYNDDFPDHKEMVKQRKFKRRVPLTEEQKKQIRSVNAYPIFNAPDFITYDKGEFIVDDSITEPDVLAHEKNMWPYLKKKYNDKEAVSRRKRYLEQGDLECADYASFVFDVETLRRIKQNAKDLTYSPTQSPSTATSSASSPSPPPFSPRRKKVSKRQKLIDGHPGTSRTTS